MGIVVSSCQTRNISWRGVTRLNAICVLISSLQHLWPPENKGVRRFSFFHSLSWLSGCVCLLLCSTVSFPGFSHSNFCVPICSTCTARFPGRILSSTQKLFSSCVMTETDLQSHKWVGYLFPHTFLSRCPGGQPAVFLGKWRAGGGVTMAQMKLVIFLSKSFHFSPFLSLSSGPLSIQTVYLGQPSSFMCTTPRQSGWTSRRGESRWLRGPTPSLRTHTILYSPLSYLLLHSNRQTNVPWKFTLGGKGRWQRLRDGASYVKAWCFIYLFF